MHLAGEPLTLLNCGCRRQRRMGAALLLHGDELAAKGDADRVCGEDARHPQRATA